MNKLCLLSITASHYRTRIYQLMDAELQCHFIFGIDNTTVKRMDTSILAHSEDVENKYIHGNIYYQPDILAKTKSYDIIINDLGIKCISAWTMLIIAKLRGQKVWNWDHGWYGREGLLKRMLKKLYFGLADGNLIYGNYAKEQMCLNGFNAKKLYVIHNSLDYDHQLQIRVEISSSDIYKKYFNNNLKTICFIGRLTEVKRLDILIEALDILASKRVHYNLVIIGDGETRQHLGKLVEKKRLSKYVWFYGACYDEQKNAELIYNADVCVSPGNVGLTAMHTMMFGCPVITHNDFKWQMPEFEAIKDGVTGSFFERDNAISLAKTINSWLLGADREKVRKACFEEIDSNWNPNNQIKVIKKAIYG